jgi:hypothetical protein
MPRYQRDHSGLQALVANLRAIADYIDQIFKTEPIVEATLDAPYDMDEVAKQFGNILEELNKSGPTGLGVYKRFPKLAEYLENAADAMDLTRERHR